jgi:uncharacterized protein
VERQQHPVVGRQRWSDLLFLHWRVSAAAVQATLPAGLFVDTYHDQAYVGIVPFFMERVRPVYLPPVPWLSWFLELNVRTYVRDASGTPGVWFYSLSGGERRTPRGAIDGASTMARRWLKPSR